MCVCVFVDVFFFLLFLCAGERFLSINQPQMNKKSSLNRANCKGCSNSLAFIIHSLSNSFACSLLSSPSLFSRYYFFAVFLVTWCSDTDVYWPLSVVGAILPLEIYWCKHRTFALESFQIHHVYIMYCATVYII